MADENLNNIGPSQVVTTIIRTLSKDAKKPRRTRGRPKKKVKSPAAAVEEVARSSAWLTTLANLALLIAIFTIIFAAHRAIQNNKNSTSVSTTAPAQQPTAVAQEVEQKVEQKIEVEEEKIAVEGVKEEAKTEVTEEPAKEIKKIKKNRSAKRFRGRGKYSSDPYTSGGPLDLDRRIPAPEVNTKNNKLDYNYSDKRNPWNAGGNLDLDSDSARDEYKKKTTLSSTE